MTPPNLKPVTILRIVLIIIGILLSGVLALFVLYYALINSPNSQITSSGVQRSYLLHVPASYRPDVSVPLVISMHGFAEWPAHQMEITRWNQMAEEHGFIVVYPAGTGFPLRWRSGKQADAQLDVQFIMDVIDRLAQEYNIDSNRIYANGLSNGGGMTFALACKLSGRIAAFGSVAGAYALPWQDCHPQRPVPAIIFHGTNDPIVSYQGRASDSSNPTLPDIPNWVNDLAAQRGCDRNPVELPAAGEVTGKRYIHCSQSADVEFYVIDKGGHSWPGGVPMPEFIVGHTTQDMDATRVMWEFFQQHPLSK